MPTQPSCVSPADGRNGRQSPKQNLVGGCLFTYPGVPGTKPHETTTPCKPWALPARAGLSLDGTSPCGPLRSERSQAPRSGNILQSPLATPLLHWHRSQERHSTDSPHHLPGRPHPSWNRTGPPGHAGKQSSVTLHCVRFLCVSSYFIQFVG